MINIATSNNFLLARALLRQAVPRTPVWLMRQAGRYLPEYQKIRKEAGSFLKLCKNPELACEVTLQPLRRFPLDAAILFSDILTIPDAMGLALDFVEGKGPYLGKPIRNSRDIASLEIPNPQEKLAYVLETVQLVRREIPNDIPLIGFAGSPWTLACYMVEGGGSPQFTRPLQLLYEEPQAMDSLLTKLTQAVSFYLAEQIEAGVNALMIFDTWGGILTAKNYEVFSLNYIIKIIDLLKKNYPTIPIILFTKGGGQWLKNMANTGCDALSLDWTTNLGAARLAVGNKVALQGNLDPAILRTNRSCIRKHVHHVLESFGFGTGHVFNLGHGISPDVLPEHVAAMVEAVHEFSPNYH